MKTKTENQKPRFKVGEKVIRDLYNQEGIIKSIAERSVDYVATFKYLVEFTYKGWFGKEKKYTEWLIDFELNKIII